MWLGMLAAALGQVPAIPVEPLNWLCSLLVAYIAQVAHWFGTPGWASVPVAAPSPVALAGIAAALVSCGRPGRPRARPARVAARRSDRRGARSRASPPRSRSPPLTPLPGPSRDRGASRREPHGRRPSTSARATRSCSIPQPGDPVLVDAGPPGTDLPARLAERGVDRLAAVVVTHDQIDHAGGLNAVLRAIPAANVVHAGAGRALRAAAAAAGAETRAVAAGDSLRAGPLRLRVLWPPPSRRRPPPGTDPNQRSVVVLARWHRFDALLTGDAEAEAAPIDPGPLDLLKVAHHGSEDAGLPALLERTDPRLALISVGAGNPYGHPHPSTLAALAEAGVVVARTDRGDAVTVSVSREGASMTG